MLVEALEECSGQSCGQMSSCDSRGMVFPLALDQREGRMFLDLSFCGKLKRKFAGGISNLLRFPIISIAPLAMIESVFGFIGVMAEEIAKR
jgi:hypothetical protein